MAAFGALLFNFFFLRPYYTLSIETGRGVAAFLVYAAVALLVAVVAGRLRETRAESERRIRQEQVLHDVAIDLLAGRRARGRAARASPAHRRRARSGRRGDQSTARG